MKTVGQESEKSQNPKCETLATTKQIRKLRKRARWLEVRTSPVAEMGEGQPVYQAVVGGWTGGFRSPGTLWGHQQEEEVGAGAAGGRSLAVGTVVRHSP